MTDPAPLNAKKRAPRGVGRGDRRQGRRAGPGDGGPGRIRAPGQATSPGCPACRERVPPVTIMHDRVRAKSIANERGRFAPPFGGGDQHDETESADGGGAVLVEFGVADGGAVAAGADGGHAVTVSAGTGAGGVVTSQVPRNVVADQPAQQGAQASQAHGAKAILVGEVPSAGLGQWVQPVLILRMSQLLTLIRAPAGGEVAPPGPSTSGLPGRAPGARFAWLVRYPSGVIRTCLRGRERRRCSDGSGRRRMPCRPLRRGRRFGSRRG